MDKNLLKAHEMYRQGNSHIRRLFIKNLIVGKRDRFLGPPYVIDDFSTSYMPPEDSPQHLLEGRLIPPTPPLALPPIPSPSLSPEPDPTYKAVTLHPSVQHSPAPEPELLPVSVNKRLFLDKILVPLPPQPMEQQQTLQLQS